MKKRLVFVLILLIVPVYAIGCCGVDHAAVKKGLDEVKASHDIILTEHIDLVEKSADPKWSGEEGAKRKDDRKKLIESLKRLVDQLRTAMEK